VVQIPHFDFRCEHCQHLEEYWVALQAVDLIKDSGLPRCRFCELGPMKRLLSVPAVILRGGGWASKS